MKAARRAPLLLCLAAGVALAFTPVIIWRLQTGEWICLDEWFAPFYLRFAAQAYYDHSAHLTDIVVPGGVTFYPWLIFIPAVWLARGIAASPFAVYIIWIALSAVTLSSGLYLVFRRFLNQPWMAAGCTILCLSDYGFAVAHPFAAQLEILASALWFHRAGLVDAPWGLIQHWRVPDPALALPFVFFQVVALARAREKPTGRNLILSGFTFGLVFYIFFYSWTLVLAGLAIALLLDRDRRQIYLATILIGAAMGAPQVLYSNHLAHQASAEAMTRFGLMTRAPRLYQQTVPALSLAALAAVGLWIWKTRRFDLIYLWSLVAGGILLSRSRILTGIYFHEYHYDWQWAPLRMALVLIAAVSIAGSRWRVRRAWVALSWMLVMLYFAGGVYLSVVCVTRMWSGVEYVRNYLHYRAQRGAEPAGRIMAAGSTIAGDEGFCELAAVAENLRVLGGEAVPRSMMVDDAQWETRVALNAFLIGMDRAAFEREARSDAANWLWEDARRRAAAITGFMRIYDEISRDPDRFIQEFDVRYVAVAAEGPQISYLRAGWTPLEAGPYWRIWERPKKAASGPDFRAARQ